MLNLTTMDPRGGCVCVAGIVCAQYDLRVVCVMLPFVPLNYLFLA